MNNDHPTLRHYCGNDECPGNVSPKESIARECGAYSPDGVRCTRQQHAQGEHAGYGKDLVRPARWPDA